MIFQMGKPKPGTEESTSGSQSGSEAVRRWRDAIQRIKPDTIKEIDLQEMKAVEWPDPSAPINLTKEVESEDDLFRLAPSRQAPGPKAAAKSALSLSQILADPAGRDSDTESTRVTAPRPASEPKLRAVRSVLPSDPKLPIDDDIKRRFGTNIRSALGSGTIIEGTFSFDSPVCIDGTLIGEVRSNSALIVGSQATVNARISVGTLIILGTVQGNVEASELVEIRNGGALEGDVISARFAIEDGGWFRGKCTPTTEMPILEPKKRGE